MVLPRSRIRGLNAVNVILVAILLSIAVTAYLIFFRPEPQAAAVRPAVQVARGEVTSTVSSSGTLQSSQTASPQFATSGTVTAVLVKVGQVVAKNAAIARIDPAPAQRELRIAQQNQIAAANSVTAAEETLEEAEEAAEAEEEAEAAAATATPSPQPTQAQAQQGGVSVTSATASLARARADEEQADQAVEAAEDAVAATTLRAPIAGTIIAVNGEVGSQASSGTSSSQGSTGSTAQGSTGTTATSGFVEIANLSSLVVTASFPEADALKIKARQAATVVLNAAPDTNLPATLAEVSPAPTTTNGVVSYAATFTFAKKPAQARIGQTATVSVVTAKAANALYIPTTAITTSGGTHTVTLADGGGSREVTVGVRGDSFTQITSGLTESDRVELIQGAIGGATGQTGQGGRQGQLGQQGQLPQQPGGGVVRVR